MARHLKQREQVLHKARWERSTSLYISEDLSPATLQKREPQIPKVKAAKQAGLDRLIISDKSASEQFRHYHFIYTMINFALSV